MAVAERTTNPSPVDDWEVDSILDDGWAVDEAWSVASPEDDVAAYKQAGGGMWSSFKRGSARLAESLFGVNAAAEDAVKKYHPIAGPILKWRDELVGDPSKAGFEFMDNYVKAQPQHPAMREAVTAANEAPEGITPAVSAFVKAVNDNPDTMGFVLDQGAELLPQILSFALGTKGADKFIPMAWEGTKKGLAAKLGGGGFISSVANTFGPNMAEAIEKGLEYDQAGAKAALQSVAQGSIDAATSAVLPWKIGPNQFVNIPAQTLIQAIGGATGEIARKGVVGEEADRGDVVAEGLLEVLGLPGEAMVAFYEGAREDRTPPPAPGAPPSEQTGDTRVALDPIEGPAPADQPGTEQVIPQETPAPIPSLPTDDHARLQRIVNGGATDEDTTWAETQGYGNRLATGIFMPLPLARRRLAALETIQKEQSEENQQVAPKSETIPDSEIGNVVEPPIQNVAQPLESAQEVQPAPAIPAGPVADVASEQQKPIRLNFGNEPVDQGAMWQPKEGKRLLTQAAKVPGDAVAENINRAYQAAELPTEVAGAKALYTYNDGQARGFLVVNEDGTTSVFVRPEDRRRGIASKLLKQAEADGFSITAGRRSPQGAALLEAYMLGKPVQKIAPFKEIEQAAPAEQISPAREKTEPKLPIAPEIIPSGATSPNVEEQEATVPNVGTNAPVLGTETTAILERFDVGEHTADDLMWLTKNKMVNRDGTRLTRKGQRLLDAAQPQPTIAELSSLPDAPKPKAVAPAEDLLRGDQEPTTDEEVEAEMAKARAAMGMDETPAPAKKAPKRPKRTRREVDDELAADGEKRGVEYSRVFHGTPYQFHAFDLSEVGSGEGAQAFGWGIYTAENEDVARTYMDSDGRKQLVVRDADGKEVARGSVLKGDKKYVADALALSKGKSNWREVATRYLASRNPALISEVERLRTQAATAAYESARPQLYAAEIPDSAVERMLDWDKSISEQPETQGTLARAFAERADNSPKRDAAAWRQFARDVEEGDELLDGGRLYKMLTSDEVVGLTQREASEFLASAGIPGIKYLDQGSRSKGEGTRNFVVFDQKVLDQINETLETKYSRASEKPFYSHALRVTEGLPDTKARSAQWLATLKNKGVKDEEIEWLGLKEWLESTGKAMSRDEVAEYIRANEIVVTETVLGRDNTPLWKAEERAEELAKEEGENYDSLSPFRQDMYLSRVNKELPEAKFGQYQLPGGEDYRELLLTLPIDRREHASALDAIDDEMLPLSEEYVRLDKLAFDPSADQAESDAAASRMSTIGRRMNDLEAKRDNLKAKNKGFESPHFDEPNVLAHVRFNERTDADGKKVLFIEELQSDWHQTGKRQGYKRHETADSIRLLRDSLILRQRALKEELDALTSADRAARIEVMRDITAINAEIDGTYGLGPSADETKVPDAPFKTTWPSLVLKRMARYAAENGFDKIAWTTGEQQAERYDLSKQVDSISYFKTKEDGKYNLRIYPESTNNAGMIEKDGLTEEEMADVIGKDMAQKVVDNAGSDTGMGWSREEYEFVGSLSGESLKVGGEGMKGFYDKILPATANKLFKKYGARVGTTSLDLGAETKINFKVQQLSDGRWAVMQINFDEETGAHHQAIEDYATRREAEDSRAEYQRGADDSINRGRAVHSLDITPALKDAALAGQPLFARGGVGQGSTVAELQAALTAAFGDSASKLQALGRLEIVETPDDIPNGPHPSDTRGAVVDGVSYIVAKNTPADMARGILLHEVGTHAGMEEMLGEQLFRDVLRQVDEMLARGDRDALKARDMVPSTTRTANVREETLAYLIQNSPQMQLVKRVIAAIRAWLYRKGIRIQLTRDDLQALAVAAIRRQAEGATTEMRDDNLYADDKLPPLPRSWTQLENDPRVDAVDHDDSMDEGRFFVYLKKGWEYWGDPQQATGQFTAGSFQEAVSKLRDVKRAEEPIPGEHKYAERTPLTLPAAKTLAKSLGYDLVSAQGTWSLLPDGPSQWQQIDLGGNAHKAFTEERLTRLIEILKMGQYPNDKPLHLQPGAAEGMTLDDELKALSIGRPIKYTEGEDWPTPEFRTDNPGGKWLAGKQEDAEAGRHKKYGHPRFITTTGSFAGKVLIPVDKLATVKGQRGEQGAPRTDDLKALTEHMKERGRLPAFNPERSDEEYAPFVTIGYDGVPWMNEGNHRIMAAKALGWKFLPVQVSYFDGGELVAGEWSPDSLLNGHEKLNGGARYTADQTKTPAFKRWFKNGVVVNEDGSPKVQYHSTDKDFTVFNTQSSEMGSHVGTQAQAEAFTGRGVTGDEGRNVIPVYINLQNPLRLIDNGEWTWRTVLAQLFDQGEISDFEYSFTADKLTRLQAKVGTLSGEREAIKVVQKLIESKGYDGIVYLNRREGLEKVPLSDVKSIEEVQAMSDREFEEEHPDAADSYIIFHPEQAKSAIGNDGNFSDSPDIRYSQQGEPPAPSEDPAERSRGLLGAIAAAQPVDRAFRSVFGLLGGIDEHGRYKPGVKVADAVRQVIREAKFDDEGRFAALNPILKTARAGLLENIGVDEKFVNVKDDARQEEQRWLIRGLDLLINLQKHVHDKAEWETLTKVISQEDVSREDFNKLAQPVRDAILELGEQAVELGLISQESFERNAGSYLHRVYQIHEQRLAQSGLAKFLETWGAKKRRKLYANGMKGRGKFFEVSMADANKAFPTLAKNDRVVMLERMSKTKDTTKSRVLDRVFVKAGDPIPTAYADYQSRGEWEARFVNDDQVTMWRDYNADERKSMGEILDARYTIAKTFLLWSKDLATGKFYSDIASNPEWFSPTRPQGVDESQILRPEGIARGTFTGGEWVRVPDTSISDTGGKKKFGKMAGGFVRADIWRDINELELMNQPHWWRDVLTQWKLNKTARSPVVHMNNVMSNFLLMDLADIRATDLMDAVRSYSKKDQHYEDARNHGALASGSAEHELRRSYLDPVLKEMEAEFAKDGEGLTGRVSILDKLLRRTWDSVKNLDAQMVRLYSVEDEIFRLATYHRRISLGDSPADAAKIAREQFIDYDIRAPFINAARNSVLPFIGYSYRAIPLVAQNVMHRPWKLAKYATIAYALQALAYGIAPGDEDEERRAIREDRDGLTWMGIPMMLRMPFKDKEGNPMFLDVRRWMPAGDVFDMKGGQVAHPLLDWAPIQMGGPLMLGAELALNKQAFSGKEITNKYTDDWMEKTGKTSSYLYRSWMPSAAYIPGSWYWQKMQEAYRGATSASGEVANVPRTTAQALGIKLSALDVDAALSAKKRGFEFAESQIRAAMASTKRDLRFGRMNDSEYQKKMEGFQEDLFDLREKALKELTGEEVKPTGNEQTSLLPIEQRRSNRDARVDEAKQAGHMETAILYAQLPLDPPEPVLDALRRALA